MFQIGVLIILSICLAAGRCCFPIYLSSFILNSSSAVGCSYLIPPEDAWLRRNGDEMTVGCYSSLQTWILRCVGHEWIGALPGNCSSNSMETRFDNTILYIYNIYIYIYIYRGGRFGRGASLYRHR